MKNLELKISVSSVATNWQMKKAFTLIELVVTVALMGMVIFFASVIFKTSVDAHRVSTANAEIMQKLRAITDQLNADFKGFRWSPWLKINFGFGQSEIDGQTVGVRSDRILFFANGDFQSTRQYDNKGKDRTMVGNVAAVFYGLADIDTYSTEENRNPRKKILLRRQTILTAEYDDWESFYLRQAAEYSDEKGLSSLSELAAQQIESASVGNWWNAPDFNDLISKNDLDPDDEDDFVRYMAKGVDDFSIQYVGVDYDEFGNVEDLFEFNEWRPTNKELNNSEDDWNDESFLPSALKFTFKLYDSKGIIKNGRTFTHIVHLGN